MSLQRSVDSTGLGSKGCSPNSCVCIGACRGQLTRLVQWVGPRPHADSHILLTVIPQTSVPCDVSGCR